MDLIHRHLGRSWALALDAEMEVRLSDILAKVAQLENSGEIVFPQQNQRFRAFQLTAFEEIKVVILGQDPYHTPVMANGLAFSVPKGQRLPPSLKRIYKELENSTTCTRPANGDLSHWASQGVLLLNTCLTVTKNKPNSHKKIGWLTFTDEIIKTISKKTQGTVFILWGNQAKSKRILIDENQHLILESVHPSPFTGNKFFGNDHFNKTNSYLQSKGKKLIGW